MNAKTWTEIKRQFPGPKNSVIRERIGRRSETGNVLGLLHVVTDSQQAGLRRVQNTLDSALAGIFHSIWQRIKK
jgi:hypothetical protein